MNDHEKDLMAKRYTNWEVAMFTIMHIKKASATSDESIRKQELKSARIYLTVLDHKLKELENV